MAPRHRSGLRGLPVLAPRARAGGIVAAAVALRIFRFPLFVFTVAALDVVLRHRSHLRRWRLVGDRHDRVRARPARGRGRRQGRSRAYGFWLHVASGVTIGGGLLWFFHDGHFDWIVIAVVGLLYIALGERVMRSSWVVFAAWGLLQVATHLAERWADVTFLAFFPITFFLFPFLGYSDFLEEEEQKTHQWARPSRTQCSVWPSSRSGSHRAPPPRGDRRRRALVARSLQGAKLEFPA